jgi:DNA-binding NtrC family response regulator
LTVQAEQLDHATFAPAAGRPLADAACTDRAKVAVVLQAAAALSLCAAAGWSLAEGWEGAAVDGGGRLSGLLARPRRDGRSDQERLRDLLLQLFRAKGRIAGRGEGRGAARELLAAWQGGIAPMSADEAIDRIFATAEFLWQPEFAEARQALTGSMTRGGVATRWLAGPAAVRERCATADPACGAPPPEKDLLRRAEALLAEGRFESARELLAGRQDVAALSASATCSLLLGDLPSALEAVRVLGGLSLSGAERIAAGDTALRVFALSGEPESAADWVATALARARSPVARAQAHLLAATAALDRGDGGDRTAVARHFTAASAEATHPAVSRSWHETRVWLALADSDGGQIVAHSRALLASRRGMRRHEAGRAWNNLGLGYLTEGDFARAEHAFRHSARLLRRCDGPLAITLAQWNLAEVRLRSGKLLEVEPILRASMAHNRRSGNRRGLAVDEALWVRLELVRGRPEAAIERCQAWSEEQTRLGLNYHRPQLAVLAARALGWLERPGEASVWLEAVDASGLGELEAEELPGLLALAGRLDEARARARAGPFAALWLPVLDGEPPPAEALADREPDTPPPPSGLAVASAATAATAAAAAAEALANLPPFRRARLLLDLELTLPGAIPRRRREAAAELFRRLGATRYAAILTRGEAGQWTALREYLGCAPGDRGALARLLRDLGAAEAELVWSSAAGDHRWLEGSLPPGGGEELIAEGAVGTLRLRAARIDEVLRAVFALLLRELHELRLQPGPLAPPGSMAPSAPAENDGATNGFVGESPLLAAAIARLRQFAPSDMPVLILGESGSGKELAARELRRASSRAGAPWVPVNCAALSETLLLSDLFGHVRGAFTGADRARAGVFETAHGGTVFLDEIGDLPPVAQGNLLRVLQEGEVRRLGESTARRVDVRLVAATHRDLAAMVAAGKFRQDLYYRLKVCTVTLPPLRERGDDRMRLAEYFVAAESRRRSLPQLQLAADARRLVETHAWPGNVRELANALQAAAALAGNGPIRASMLDLGAPAAAEAVKESSAYHHEIDEFRRQLLRRALRASGGNRAEAARRLGLSRQALSYLVHHLGLDDIGPEATGHPGMGGAE